MTITIKAVVGINFSEEDKEIIKKACNLVDKYGDHVRGTLHDFATERIKIDDNLESKCFQLADAFDDAYGALRELNAVIKSFEK